MNFGNEYSKHARVVWLTGLPGAGKTTTACELVKQIRNSGRSCIHLDGDDIRQRLNADLDFTPDGRMENIRRISEVARVLSRQGLSVVVSCVSPLICHRALAKEIIGGKLFREVYVYAPLSVCESRDPKQLYARARQGLMTNLTGAQDKYEPPNAPYIKIDTQRNSLEENTHAIVTQLDRENMEEASPINLPNDHPA